MYCEEKLGKPVGLRFPFFQEDLKMERVSNADFILRLALVLC